MCSVYLQNTNPPALLFIDNQRLIGFWHKQNRAVLIRKFLYVNEASRVACNSDETQTTKISAEILLLFGRDGLYDEIQASVWQE